MAVIAFQVAVAQTNEGQRYFADLQKKYEPQRAAAEESLSDEINSLDQELQAQSHHLEPCRPTRAAAAAIETKKKQLDHDTRGRPERVPKRYAGSL